MSNPIFADAVIVGGGPVGSLIAYQLARFGCKPFIIEQDDKEKMPCYGRATTIWPRTVELLDQVDLAEGLMQIGVATRSGLHFHEGRRVHGGLMFGSRMDKLGDTVFKLALHLRQRLTEEHFTKALADYGIYHHMLHSIEGYSIDEDHPYPVTVNIRDLRDNSEVIVKAKYLIGSDGGKSTVRKLTNIAFNGKNTTHRWIRMDALVKTNMPNPRSLNSIDSQSHGQILWCPIDSGMTRIGYVFSKALIDKYGGEANITQEVVIAEAKEALQPFNVEFLAVDWFTIYGIGQRIAETFCAKDRIFLAGDSCHTHSSGSAQGLNTGVHDAINISWKLALNIRGLGNRALLDSYDSERRPVVQEVIDNDKTISMLISGQYPPQFQGRNEPTRVLLTEWFDDMNKQLFTLGLSIAYPSNCVNMPGLGPSRCVINPGERGPDVYLTSIGTGDPIRLHTILKNEAKFGIVVFAGNPSKTFNSLAEAKSALPAFTAKYTASLFRWITITSVSGNGGQEVLGMPPFGNGTLYFDEKVQAHEMYGVDSELGAIVVFRPDGWIATTCGLDETGNLDRYFEGILCP